MKESARGLPYAIAIIASTILWAATSAISGRREPWDASIYWTVTYPLAIALAGFLGYAFPQKPWRWGVIVIFTQIIVTAIAGAGFGLLPLGAILMAILSLPAVVAARLAARVRQRRA